MGFCRKNQIEVVAFIPPFAPSVIDKMEEGGNHTYLAKVAPSVQEIFDVYGYEFYDNIGHYDLYRKKSTKAEGKLSAAME